MSCNVRQKRLSGKADHVTEHSFLSFEYSDTFWGFEIAVGGERCWNCNQMVKTPDDLSRTRKDMRSVMKRKLEHKNLIYNFPESLELEFY